MDADFPAWYLAAAVEPKDEQLRKRWKGVEELGAGFTDHRVLDLVRLFLGHPTDSGIAAVQSAIQRADAAFMAKGNEQEVKVLAGATLAHLFATAKQANVSDTAALALLCASFAPIGPDAVVPAILERAVGYLNGRRSALRSQVTPPPSATAKFEAKLKAARERNGKGEHVEAVNGLAEAVSFLAQMHDHVRKLSEQQSQFREESNILWWVTGAHSRDEGKAFSEIDSPRACMVIAKELADLTESPVGVLAAPAFIARTLAHTKQAGQLLALPSVIAALDVEWASDVSDAFEVDGVGDVCPLGHAVYEWAKSEGQKTWQAAYKRGHTDMSLNKKIAPAAYAAQFYDELLLQRLIASTGAE